MKPFVWQCKAKQGIASCYVYDAASAERAADTWTVTELYTADQLREAQVKVLREHFGVNSGSVVACRLIQAQVDILRKAIDRTKQMAYSKFFAEELRLMITELESMK